MKKGLISWFLLISLLVGQTVPIYALDQSGIEDRQEVVKEELSEDTIEESETVGENEDEVGEGGVVKDNENMEELGSEEENENIEEPEGEKIHSEDRLEDEGKDIENNKGEGNKTEDLESLEEIEEVEEWHEGDPIPSSWFKYEVVEGGLAIVGFSPAEGDKEEFEKYLDQSIGSNGRIVEFELPSELEFEGENLAIVKISGGNDGPVEGFKDYFTYKTGTYNHMRNLRIKLPTSLVEIGDNAFRECKALKGDFNINELSALESIGKYGFLESGFSLDNQPLTETKELKSIGDGAFSQVERTDRFILEDLPNLKTIGVGIIDGTPISESFEMKNIGIEEIKENTFMGCSVSGDIILENLPDLKGIGRKAFHKVARGSGPTSYNDRSKSLYLKNLPQLREIGEDAFSGGMAESGTWVYRYHCYAFGGNLVLEGLPTLETVGKRAFYYNRFKGNLDLSNLSSLKTIGDEAFKQSDSGKEKMTFQMNRLENLEKIGYQAFYRSFKYDDFKFEAFPKLTSVGEAAFTPKEVNEFLIADLPLLKTVGKNAFYSDIKAKNFTIKNLEVIENIDDVFGRTKVEENFTLSKLESLKGFQDQAFKKLDIGRDMKIEDFPVMENLNTGRDYPFGQEGNIGGNVVLSKMPELKSTGNNSFKGFKLGGKFIFDDEIMENINNIGQASFANCELGDPMDLGEELKKFSNLEYIEKEAFKGWSFPKGLNMEGLGTVKSIGEAAFGNAQIKGGILLKNMDSLEELKNPFKGSNIHGDIIISSLPNLKDISYIVGGENKNPVKVEGSIHIKDLGSVDKLFLAQYADIRGGVYLGNIGGLTKEESFKLGYDLSTGKDVIIENFPDLTSLDYGFLSIGRIEGALIFRELPEFRRLNRYSINRGSSFGDIIFENLSKEITFADNSLNNIKSINSLYLIDLPMITGRFSSSMFSNMDKDNKLEIVSHGVNKDAFESVLASNENIEFKSILSLKNEDKPIYLDKDGRGTIKLTNHDSSSMRFLEGLDYVIKPEGIDLEEGLYQPIKFDGDYVGQENEVEFQVDLDGLTEDRTLEISYSKDGSMRDKLGTIELKKPFRVVFKDGEDILGERLVQGGKKLEDIEDPKSSEGYIFRGWREDGQEEFFDLDQAINKDLILQAVFVEKPERPNPWPGVEAKHRVRFILVDEDGKEELIKTSYIENGGRLDKPGDPEVEGQIFMGWFSDLNWGEEYDFSEGIKSDQLEEINIYGRLVKVPERPGGIWPEVGVRHTIRRHLLDGELDKINLDLGERLVRPGDLENIAGYNFKGWYSDPAKTKLFEFPRELSKNRAEVIDIYGLWEKVESPEPPIDPEDPEKPEIPGGSGGGRPVPPTRPEGEKPLDPEKPIEPEGPGTPEIEGEHKPYLEGYGDGTIRPEADIRREEVAAMVYRILEKEGAGQHDFPDIEKGRWSEKYIGKLALDGIVEGYEDGNFRPRESMTRAEFVTLVARAYGLKELDRPSFKDTENHWAYGYIGAMIELDWVEGFGDGNFRPEAKISRAEAVTILNRILDREVDKEGLGDHENPFTDLEPGKWYYADILEASLKHEYGELDDEEIWLRENK